MALRDRIQRVPLPADPDRAAAMLADLDPQLTGGPAGELLAGAAGSSPYLARLIGRHADELGDILGRPPETVFQGLIDGLRADIPAAGGMTESGILLRRAKSRAALLIALADLCGAWTLEDVTGALTALADTACETAAGWLLAREADAGRLPGGGYTLLAMGKMGAHELNYSSDIDLIALFDDDRFDGADAVEAKAIYIKITRNIVKLLSENTADGYVFRTDLRLRPSPSTTPVCMAMSAAERYYESVGRTWERAAHIKARPLVDATAGAAYLQALAPFVWRRHLDFAAIDDVYDMLRKIRDKRAQFTVGALPGHDLKLGPGGIREIEFFAQTRQLIMGGRDPSLRPPGTLDALAALTAAGIVAEQTRAGLSENYRVLRTVEHRLQMMEDAQTQTYPAAEAGRRRLAMLSGEAQTTRFEAALARRLGQVNDNTGEFFGTGETQRTSEDFDEDALARAGFERPADAARQIARWHDGQIAATRTERARGLYLGLESRIVHGLAGAASPDQALVQFDRFLSGLPAGVQVFSLFSANPRLLDLIIEICAAAPRLASYLGRRSQTLDALLDRDFWEPIPESADLVVALEERLSAEDGYERVLDAVRRWSREMRFRAGVHVLRGIADHEEAGRAFTRIAEACLVALLPHVAADFAERHGPMPGDGLAVIAMGKLGSSDMTSGSDLDLIIVYDPAGAEMSEGRRPLAVRAYYTRLTQALVSALTAPTAEGVLYEVDMRLRPSGRQGPVAVSIEAFEGYQTKEAWVWEHLALTRARIVAGPADLRERMEAIVARALAARVGSDNVLIEAREMRARLAVSNAAARGRLWDLKLGAGGLMDIEFLTQTGALSIGLRTTGPIPATLADLAEREWLTHGQSDDLARAFSLSARLQQIERVALETPLDPATAGAELRDVLVRATGQTDFSGLEALLIDCRARAATICADRLSQG